LQIGKPSPQPQSIELIDWKHPDAALRTPRAADQPLAAATRSFGQRGVHDLNQCLIFDREGFGIGIGSWRMTRHDDT
jgi:hypothetical protein